MVGSVQDAVPIRIVPPSGAGKGFAATSASPSKVEAAASAPGSCVFTAIIPTAYPDTVGRAYDRPMTDGPERSLDLHLDITDDEELAELERALLRARAAELGEVRRRNVRLTAGYGDDTTREVLDDEGRRAQIRYELLDRLLESLRGRKS